MAAKASPAKLLCFALLATVLPACQANRSGINPKVDSVDAMAMVADTQRATDAALPDASLSDAGLSPDTPSPAGDTVSAAMDSTNASPGTDARVPDAVSSVPGDGPTPDLAMVTADTASLRPDTPLLPPDSAMGQPDSLVIPRDTAPDLPAPPVDTSPVDTQPADTQSPDTQPVDTQLPDTRAVPTPLYAWPIDNLTTLGGNELTANGTPTIATSAPGTVVCFDGDNDGLQSQSNPITGLPQFTLQLLFRPDFTSTSQPRILHIQMPEDSSRRLMLELRANADGQFYAYAYFAWDTLAVTLRDTQALHAPGQWTWLAVSYDGQTMRLFVNGVEEDNGTSAQPFGPMGSAPMSLGMRQTKQYFFEGCLGKLITSDVALDPADLQRP